MTGWTTCIVCDDHFYSDNPSDPICGAMCLREHEQQCEIDEMEMEEVKNERSDQKAA